MEAKTFDYPEAARTIHLWLKPFCNEDLPYPEMIADAARKASTMIDALKQEKEWISVEDALPEVGEYVLVNVGTDTVLKGRLLYNGWVAFFADGEKTAGPIRPVTHWKHLPEPPQ